MSMLIARKKIIFFDGDGTIWYPKETKRTKPPYWIYGDTNSRKINYRVLKHLILSQSALAVLKKLKKMGMILVLLSTHPHIPKIANIVLRRKLKHLGIEKIFDEYRPTAVAKNAKGKEIIKLLKKFKLSKASALMVGDSYHYDYLSAKAVGVEAVLIKSDYLKQPARGPRVKKIINEISGLLIY